CVLRRRLAGRGDIGSDRTAREGDCRGYAGVERRQRCRRSRRYLAGPESGLTVFAIARFVPELSGIRVTDPRTELGALGRKQVLSTLLVGAVGFGGMFAVYTDITTTLTDVAGLSLDLVPLALALFGMGMIAGSILGGVLADRGADSSVPQRFWP